MSHFTPKYPECTICKNYRPETGHVRCLPCGAGEFFEEKIDDRHPDNWVLMEMFKNMRGHGESDDE